MLQYFAPCEACTLYIVVASYLHKLFFPKYCCLWYIKLICTLKLTANSTTFTEVKLKRSMHTWVSIALMKLVELCNSSTTVSNRLTHGLMDRNVDPETRYATKHIQVLAKHVRSYCSILPYYTFCEMLQFSNGLVDIHYLNISSINIGWSYTLEFLICPVDSVMNGVHSQTDRPPERVTDQHTSVWAVHSCSFYLSLVPRFWPEHYSERMINIRVSLH